MKTEKLSLKHKQILLSLLKSIQSPFSDYSFIDLYLFREKHQYQVIYFKEFIFISGISFDHYHYIMPLFKLNHENVKHLISLSYDYDFIFPVQEKDLNLFPNHQFKTFFHEGDSDYLYLAQKFHNYSGRKLQKKRNFVHQYKSHTQIEAVPILKSNIQDALRILNHWQDKTGLPESETDYYPCRECLELFQELPVYGYIHYTDKLPTGFIIGEKLSDIVADLHFVKADHKIKGIFPFMYQHYSQNLDSDVCYLNFEQDLGLEELRKAKSAFYPDAKITKYRIKKI